MKKEERQRIAFELVEQHQKLVGPTDLFVRSEIEAFDGRLLTITWTNVKEQRAFDNFVFFDILNAAHYFGNPGDLTRWLSNQKSGQGLLSKILERTGVPGLLAVGVTGAIVYLALVKQSAELQQVLAHALSIILGFYFGSKTVKDSGASHSPIGARKRHSESDPD